MNKITTLLVLISLFAGCVSSNTDSQKRTADSQENDLVDLNPLCPENVLSPNIPVGDVVGLAEQEEPASYDFVEEKKAEIVSVDDGKSFAVWWQPEDFDVSTDTVFVSLHGHGAWATRDFEVWYPQMEERGYAYLGLQWWFGRSLENEGYYEPENIYTLVRSVLESKGVEPGNVIFQGFSMGSARSYGISMYDKQCNTEPYFAANIANSGPWEDDYPLYEKILNGDFGEVPLSETHWILFCGEEDYNDKGNHQGYVCEGMNHTQTRLEELGATIDLFLKDPKGDHGSLTINSENSSKALDVAETLLVE